MKLLKDNNHQVKKQVKIQIINKVWDHVQDLVYIDVDHQVWNQIPTRVCTLVYEQVNEQVYYQIDETIKR